MFVNVETLAFYFNGGAQCSLYLIHTEHMKMGCSVVPSGKTLARGCFSEA